ncbi:MAG: helix-turn-helix domain-containing protein [Halalkalicoccus sp.]
MTLVAELTLPSTTFLLGRVMRAFPEATVELERVVPFQETIMPLFWVDGDDIASIESELERSPQVRSVDVLTTTDERALFDVHWSPGSSGLTEALLNTGATVLDARGTADSWDFRLRFDTHEDLSAFNMALTDRGTPVTLRRIYRPDDEGPAPLSSLQRETLQTAYRRGYFQVPRRINQAELAEELEISDSALSQRLRRGISKLIEADDEEALR